MKKSIFLCYIGIIGMMMSSCQNLSQYTYSNRLKRQNEKLLREYKRTHPDATNIPKDIVITEKKVNEGKKEKLPENSIPAGKTLTAYEYVDIFKDYAMESMRRKSVPASITLAQGLLESGLGNGELARKANNHFGIKCHSSWTGPYVLKDDDAKNECFRKYESVLDSYEDHADFLRTRSRYAFLFDYKITDYKKWCYGLKKAGYATDPKYPVKLIDLIEKYRLYEYDRMVVEGK